MDQNYPYPLNDLIHCEICDEVYHENENHIHAMSTNNQQNKEDRIMIGRKVFVSERLPTYKGYFWTDTGKHFFDMDKQMFVSNFGVPRAAFEWFEETDDNSELRPSAGKPEWSDEAIRNHFSYSESASPEFQLQCEANINGAKWIRDPMLTYIEKIEREKKKLSQNEIDRTEYQSKERKKYQKRISGMQREIKELKECAKTEGEKNS